MKTFLQRRDPWGHGISLWLICGVAMVLPLMGWSLTHIRLENDVAGWLPKDDPQTLILDWYQKHFPAEDRILLSWDGCTLTDPRIDLLVQQLSGIKKNGQREGGSPLIREVRQPADLLKRMAKEGVPFETALSRTHGLLTGDGPLCLRFSDSGRLRGDYLRKEVLKLAEQHGLKVTIVQQSLSMPTNEGLDIEDEASFKLNDAISDYIRSRPVFDLQLSWPRMHIDSSSTESFRQALLTLAESDVPQGQDAKPCIEETFFIPGSMAAVSVALNEAGAADHKAALADIREALQVVGIPAESVHLGGRPVAGTALNQAVKHAGWNRAFPIWDLPQRSPILLSALVTFIFSIIVLRSIRLTILVQAVSILCAIATTSLVPVTGGSMNMVLVVMPTLLVVLTVSGAIHLCNYWKSSEIDDPVKSVHHAAKVAWLPCLGASGTTAIGFASLMTGTLIPVRDFGIYAAIGCVVSFGCVLYLLPALMLYWPRRPPQNQTHDTSAWRLLGKCLTTYPTVVSLVCLAVTALCTWGLKDFRTETKVIRYFPDESRVAQDYYFLEENLSGIVPVDTIVKFDRASQQQIPFMDRARKVMQIQESLRKHPEVSGTLSLASFLDLEDREIAGLTRMQRMQHKRRESAIEERIHEKLAAGGEEAEGLASMLAIAKGDTDWLKKGDRRLNADGDELWRITCQSSIMSDYDYADLTRELDEITQKHLAEIGSAGTGHIVTGLIPIFLRTQQALLESLIRSFGVAYLVIGFVVALMLRSVVASFYAMLPNIMPVLMMFGLLAWGGIRVDIGTMITASVALGIAVDGTLHLITWFQLLIAQGLSRKEAVSVALEHCGPALWQTSAAIGLGMLALFPVELLLISRFGWIMAGMIFFALVGDVILLPALLAGPLGAILEKKTGKANIASASRVPENPRDDVTVPASLSLSSGGLEPGAGASLKTESNDSGIVGTTAQTRPITGHPHFGRVSKVSRKEKK